MITFLTLSITRSTQNYSEPFAFTAVFIRDSPAVTVNLRNQRSIYATHRQNDTAVALQIVGERGLVDAYLPATEPLRDQL